MIINIYLFEDTLIYLLINSITKLFIFINQKNINYNLILIVIIY